MDSFAASCGPSNPLQTLSKHQQHDTSLQRDRFNSQGPASQRQSFRSTPQIDPQLQHEAEAFMRGEPLPGPELGMGMGMGMRGVGARPQGGGIGMDGWADDFQRLQVSQPKAQPLFMAVNGKGKAVMGGGRGGWGAEFLAQRRQTAPPQPASQAYAAQRTGMGMSMGYAGVGGQLYHEQVQQQPTMNQQEQVKHDQALDQAFAEAEKHAFESINVEQDTIEIQKWDQQGLVEMYRDKMDEVLREKGAGADPLEVYHHTESDMLNTFAPEPELETAAEQQTDKPVNHNDALAATAGSLLESLKDETDEKFQQSSFMQLMRKLRDGEVHVEGDKMVETVEPVTTYGHTTQDTHWPHTKSGAFTPVTDADIHRAGRLERSWGEDLDFEKFENENFFGRGQWGGTAADPGNANRWENPNFMEG
ncbi:hypothetical protein SAICODRAFT_6011 [Saitoella complicata NRRL Y-17804]|uniref:uncharacterized protein n=1 Tax=Saitoella complicata (strain BCRC 22490 / CBS 7301 / JCM 7358 / NBRC 10748 / NRRL Y-17804) TaxID=698492 RepID=UPI0008668F26|nr:uncharacterized protein SAICODRAFT_6011 [Saitoella complicata NRRL Y-17804]ODQ54817.1 hypothetical protein SAICODRAFT_6011 [Saitoella complicata NRRL Y-17804]